MDEKQVLRIRAAAGGLELPDVRLDTLLPALRRLEATAKWLRDHDLGFTEPALTFDAQPGGPSDGD